MSGTQKDLQMLLDGFPVDKFLQNVWGLSPLYIKGSAGRIREMFNRNFETFDLIELAHQTAKRGHKNFGAYAGISRAEILNGEPRRPLRRIDHLDIESALEGGSSLLLENLLDPRLSDFASSLKSQIGHIGPVQVRATITPYGGKHTPHIDPTCSLFIHCEGAKRFRISQNPVIRYPIDSAVVTKTGELSWANHRPSSWELIQGVNEECFSEFIMTAGDVLYFPAGTVHETEALTERCAGINFQFVHPDASKLIFPHLRKMLLENPEWRHIRTPTDGGGQISVEYIDERLRDLRELIASIGGVDFAKISGSS
ncbi:JmjC domain-containing protein [Streptomyces sp. NPDC001286]